MAESKCLLIVYHSQSVTISKMDDAVIEGTEVPVRNALEASPDDVLLADGLILGTPENFGYMSGAMKYFLDRIYYACEDKVVGMPYAVRARRK